MCPVCCVAKVVKSLVNKHKRMARFHRMQREDTQKITPVVQVETKIATGNHSVLGVRHG